MSIEKAIEEISKMQFEHRDYRSALFKKDGIPLMYIESVDLAIEALEKQIAKKPSEQSYNQSFMDEGIDDGVEYLCPNCKSIVGAYSNSLEDWLGQQKHCESCGQKIDWSEV